MANNDKKKRSGAAASFELAGTTIGRQPRDPRQQLNVRVSDKDWEKVQIFYALTDGGKSRNQNILDLLMPAIDAALAEYPEDLLKRARALVRSQAKLNAGLAGLRDDAAPTKKR